jgi:hypothetical protein
MCARSEGVTSARGRICGGSDAVTIVGAVGFMGWLATPDDVRHWLIREAGVEDWRNGIVGFLALRIRTELAKPAFERLRPSRDREDLLPRSSEAHTLLG